jgi:hypothetical protein
MHVLIDRGWAVAADCQRSNVSGVTMVAISRNRRLR